MVGKNTRRCLLALVLMALLVDARLPVWRGVVQARADDLPEEPAIRTVRLQLEPQPEPQYALQYLFETPYMEQRPGNAAPLYEMALSLMARHASEHPDVDGKKLNQWVRSPLPELPVKEVRATLSQFENVVHYLDLATRCERCTWEYPVREEGFRCPMPNLSDFRTLASVLTLKARLQVADGAIPDAMETMRVGISMARDLGGGPFLIQNLVGVAIAKRMADEIEGLIQAPGAPNLYWALTSLPHPLADMRASLQMESAALYAELPELLRLEDHVLSNEQVVQVWNKAATLFEITDTGPDKWLRRTAMAAHMMKMYPEAKTHLLHIGRSVEEVESMPVLHVVLLYEHRQYRVLRDMQYKWSNVPYWQARDGMARSASALGEYISKQIALPLLYTFPALDRVRLINARLERDLAMLRCVEAIRMYAAAHDGKLPGSLDEIRDVPVPLDPLRGRAFTYRVDAGKAVLESPAPEGSPKDGLRYEITMK